MTNSNSGMKRRISTEFSDCTHDSASITPAQTLSLSQTQARVAEDMPTVYKKTCMAKLTAAWRSSNVLGVSMKLFYVGTSLYWDG